MKKALNLYLRLWIIKMSLFLSWGGPSFPRSLRGDIKVPPVNRHKVFKDPVASYREASISSAPVQSTGDWKDALRSEHRTSRKVSLCPYGSSIYASLLDLQRQLSWPEEQLGSGMGSKPKPLLSWEVRQSRMSWAAATCIARGPHRAKIRGSESNTDNEFQVPGAVIFPHT